MYISLLPLDTLAGIMAAEAWLVLSRTGIDSVMVKGRLQMDVAHVDEAKISELVEQMTLEEKVSLCHASSKFSIASVERLGIPSMVISDGPHGVREHSKLGVRLTPALEDEVTYLPVGIALAATWNRDMARLHGSILGREARARGKHIILGPGVNIMRTPLCGRNFEYMGEDPYLAGTLAVQYIKGVQSEDVAACVKHFALNNQELNRKDVDVHCDERPLREIYLPAFEMAVKHGQVLTVMGSYNLFRGQHCCHNEFLLNHVLKEQWGFRGLLISDWNGTHSTGEAARYGLDVEMGTAKADYDDFYLARPFLEGLRNGTYSQSLVNDKVRRVLRVMMAIGLIGRPRQELGCPTTDEHFQGARRIAEESMVLLKNNGLLPLNGVQINSLAVIGRNAINHHARRGGSSAVETEREITPLQGLQELLGDKVRITYVQGYPSEATEHELIPAKHLSAIDGTSGWTIELHDDWRYQGRPPVHVEKSSVIDFAWPAGDLPLGLVSEQRSVRALATLQLPEDGLYELAFTGSDQFKVFVDGQLKFDVWEFGEGGLTEKLSLHGKSGDLHQLELRFMPRGHGAGELRVSWLAPSARRQHLLSHPYGQAVAVAREADAVLFVGGLTHRDDLEGRDRDSLKLPHDQDKLIEALAEVNPRLAVFLVGGGAVEMPWVDKAAAIVQAWYAGAEGGRALADVAFGRVNPSGKLPCTFPKSLADTPVAVLGQYQSNPCHYNEGLLVGYRWYDAKGIEPLFPFGHGLSYTTFTYGPVHLLSDGAAGDEAVATFSVAITNSGKRHGSEVVQLYVSKPDSMVERPPRELKGFQKVHLGPGETKMLQFHLGRRDLAYYDVAEQDWIVEPGEYSISFGSSSRDLRCHASTVVPAR